MPSNLFDWQRDELVLALDVYYRMLSAAPGPSMPEIRHLSALLQSATLHPLAGRPPNFRSPASVVMKLMNFRRLDPTYAGTGLTAGSRADREVWNEFAQDRERVTAAASVIRHLLASEEMVALPDDIHAEGSEGRLLTRLHRIRERDPKLTKIKKISVLRRSGQLACEICNFVFASFYGDRGADFIECHHIVPLSEMNLNRKTHLDDLALVCANCHRMIHAKRPWATIKELRDIVQSLRNERNTEARGTS